MSVDIIGPAYEINATIDSENYIINVTITASCGSPSGGGDMTKAVYDPQLKEADVYDFDNFDEPSTTVTTLEDTDNIPMFDSVAQIWQTISGFDLKAYLSTLFQSILVSGTNIRTINGQTLLGSDNLVISGSGGESVSLGAFTGPLLFDNPLCNYYSEYDLGVSGTPNFSIVADAKVMSYVMVPFVSNGTTPVVSESQLNQFFRERNNFPENRILPLGTFNLYFWKLPNSDNVAVSVTPVFPYIEPITDTVPFFEDWLFYVNRFFDTPTTIGANLVTSMANRRTPSNPLINTTGANYVVDNPTTKRLSFVSTSGSPILTMNDVIATQGNCTYAFVGNVVEITLAFSKPNASSLRTFSLYLNGGKIAVANGLAPTNNITDTLSSRPAGSMSGNCIVFVSVNSLAGTATFYYHNQNFTGTSVKSFTPEATATIALNRVEKSSSGAGAQMLAFGALDRTINQTEFNSLRDYFLPMLTS